MASIEKHLDVHVPLHTAYNQWTQFEEFPMFMDGVQEVRQLDDTTMYWRANIAGKEEEWKARITEQTPDRRIAWESMTGARNNGAVSFSPVDANTTRVTLHLDYEPEGVIEKLGDLLGFVDRKVDGDLHRFKDFIESRGQETGAWRGKVQGGQKQVGS
jgi:uncharacterized membrane protein